jgi:hypothetical protein
MADEDVSTKRRNFATRSLASWYKMLEVGQGAPKVSMANFKSPQLATSGYFLMATDSGVQYLSIRYTERLGDAEIVASVGSKGDSNALAESFNGLYKNELIHRKGPWRNVEHVEWATLNYVDWFNNRRIHESLGYMTPLEKFAEFVALTG